MPFAICFKCGKAEFCKYIKVKERYMFVCSKCELELEAELKGKKEVKT